MNLHLLREEKISKLIYDSFELALPDQNEYIIWENKNLPFKFPHNIKKTYLINENHYPHLDYSKYNKIIIHSLDRDKIKFIKKNININIPIYWNLWGGELYSLLSLKGYKLYYKSKPIIPFKSKIASYLKQIGIWPKWVKDTLEFIKERNITLCSSETEYELIRKNFKKYTLKLKNESRFFYYPIDSILSKDLLEQETVGNNIWIGNSASFTNNHEYVFKILKTLKLDSTEIIMPLSYGGHPKYINKVIRKGFQLFGNQFRPLKKFISLQEYNLLLKNTKSFILGNWRQEGVGNLIIALYLGAKIFISKKSPMVKILKDWDVIFYILEEDCNTHINNPLTKEQKNFNRNKVLSLFNKQRQINLIKEIYN